MDYHTTTEIIKTFPEVEIGEMNKYIIPNNRAMRRVAECIFKQTFAPYRPYNDEVKITYSDIMILKTRKLRKHGVYQYMIIVIMIKKD